jgi:hypothetical protein
MTAVIRASSLPSLFDCPARWASIHIDGKRMPTNTKAMLGKAVHASTAVFDQSTIDGAGITIEESASAAVDTIRKPDEEVDWEDESPNDAEKVALSLHRKYCGSIAPTQTFRAVEVKCDKLEITDLGITLTGTTDRVYETKDGLGIGDVKTGKQAVSSDDTVNTKGHAYQMGVYELLAEKGSGLPITQPARIFGLNTAKTPASQRVGIGEISGARDVLLGDQESPGILEMAAKLIHSGDFWGNPKSMLCHQRYCPVYSTCKFRK